MSQVADEANKQQEFDKLDEEETIYKLVGPILLKQDKGEAQSTVKGRLDFIGNEMSVITNEQIRQTHS